MKSEEWAAKDYRNNVITISRNFENGLIQNLSPITLNYE